MENGILFSKADKSMKEGQKRYCFADVQKSALWDGKEQEEVSYQQAQQLDKIIRNVILK